MGKIEAIQRKIPDTLLTPSRRHAKYFREKMNRINLSNFPYYSFNPKRRDDADLIIYAEKLGEISKILPYVDPYQIACGTSTIGGESKDGFIRGDSSGSLLFSDIITSDLRTTALQIGRMIASYNQLSSEKYGEMEYRIHNIPINGEGIASLLPVGGKWVAELAWSRSNVTKHFLNVKLSIKPNPINIKEYYEYWTNEITERYARRCDFDEILEKVKRAQTKNPTLSKYIVTEVHPEFMGSREKMVEKLIKSGWELVPVTDAEEMQKLQEEFPDLEQHTTQIKYKGSPSILMHSTDTGRKILLVTTTLSKYAGDCKTITGCILSKEMIEERRKDVENDCEEIFSEYISTLRHQHENEGSVDFSPHTLVTVALSRLKLNVSNDQIEDLCLLASVSLIKGLRNYKKYKGVISWLNYLLKAKKISDENKGNLDSNVKFNEISIVLPEQNKIPS